MDEETKIKAVEKAEAVKQKIGYPSNLNTMDELNIYYKNLNNIRSNEYFSNILNIRLYATNKNVIKLNVPVNKNEWSMAPPTVNAYYSPSFNEIVFPAGILQPPFFQSKYLHASNYGGIGVVIGHELTHGFDDQGSQYDKDGNLKSWWPSSVLANFKEKIKCIRNQYSKYTIQDGETVNGNLTLGNVT